MQRNETKPPSYTTHKNNLSDPSATDRATTRQRGLPHPGEYLRLHPLPRNRCSETKKYGPNERTDQSSRKKIQLSYEERANLSDAEFKTLVISMLTEMVEYGLKIRGKSQSYEKWNKGNQQWR